ncbi:MAG: DUF2207 domain-containing protein [Chloroflexota bacterium]
MNRKILVGWIFVFWVTFFLAVNPALADTSYVAERYDVVVVIQPDGTLNVTETIAFRFDGGDFTYVFRELAYKNLDTLDHLQASMDGKTLPIGDQAGQVEIAESERLKVTWHFAPMSDSTHEFALTYRVQGAVRQQAGADTLIWRAIPEGHEYIIERGSIRVEYPLGVQPVATPTLQGAAAESEAGSRAVVFSLARVDEDTSVDVTVQFPAGSLITQPPAWQAQQERQDHQIAAALPFGLGAAGLTGFLGLLAVILIGRSFQRGENVDNGYVADFPLPPRAIPPALAARLTGSSMPFLGTLFDLARRRVLKIEEGPTQWGSRTFAVMRLPYKERLAQHEQVMLEVLFAKSKDERVGLDQVSSLFYNSRFNQALENELAAAGWQDTQRSFRRGRFMAFSGLGMLGGTMAVALGIILGGISLELEMLPTFVGAILLGMGIAAGGMGLIGLLVALGTSTLSDEGVRQASAWHSFTGYLRRVTRGKETASPDMFERYLPYAASFGIATEWAKFFQKMTGVPVPAWFQGIQAGVEDGSFVAVLAAISTVDSSAASASAAASGASGGGASGAG